MATWNQLLAIFLAMAGTTASWVGTLHTSNQEQLFLGLGTVGGILLTLVFLFLLPLKSQNAQM